MTIPGRPKGSASSQPNQSATLYHLQTPHPRHPRVRDVLRSRCDRQECLSPFARRPAVDHQEVDHFRLRRIYDLVDPKEAQAPSHTEAPRSTTPNSASTSPARTRRLAHPLGQTRMSIPLCPLFLLILPKGPLQPIAPQGHRWVVCKDIDQRAGSLVRPAFCQQGKYMGGVAARLTRSSHVFQ